MSKKKQVLPEEQQTKVIELLNRRLADTIDLMLQTRQAYWNIKGPHFIALRELFNRVAQGVEEDADLIAKRIVPLGGMAEGTAQAVARRSSLDEYWLSTTLAAFGKYVRYASEQATELQDADTAAIFTEIACGIDTWLWFVEMSQQAGRDA